MDEYLIADLHLGHEAVIKYCDRPFNDVEEMNKVIVAEWNNTVNPEDFVYFLGDLCLDNRSSASGTENGVFCNRNDYWLQELNGNIQFIKGNHDKRRRGLNFGMKFYGEKRFLMVHAPQTAGIIHNVEKSLADWTIHGHVHEMYKHIDWENRLINVSCEVLNYRPLYFPQLLDELDEGRDFEVCEKHFNIVDRR